MGTFFINFFAVLWVIQSARCLIDAKKLKREIPLKLNYGKDLFELKLSANNQRSTKCMKIFILSLPSSPIFKLHTELNSEIFITNKYGKERKENVQQRASEDTSDIINFYDHNNR